MIMRMRVGMLRVIVIVNVARFTVHMVARVRMVVFDDDIDLGSGQPAAAGLPHFEMRANVQRGSRLLEQGKGHARVDKRAKQHVAADAGEAPQISDSHGNKSVPMPPAASGLPPAAPHSKTRSENLCNRASRIESRL